MLILASNSPRRQQLLSFGGWEFQILSPDVDESVMPGEEPQAYVLRVAGDKARSVMNALLQHPIPDAIILAADTAVVAPAGNGTVGDILGKPSSPLDALEMLRRLRGKTHQVYTGLVAVRLLDGLRISEVVGTAVEMRCYDETELLSYVESGDPMDKAGAYAIQSPTFRPVQNLQGCYANVMGLPVCHVARLLARLDCPPAENIFQRCQPALDYHCEITDQLSWN
jgi:septum formation protein